MSAPTIHPTGTCFDDALEFVLSLAPDEHELAAQIEALEDTVRIVHAICLGHDASEHYAHAWVEHLHAGYMVCWQAGTFDGARIYFAIDRKDFYRGYQVARTVKYTLRQAAVENLASGHMGPWDPELYALANKAGEGNRILGRFEGVSPRFMLHDLRGAADD